MLGPRYATGGGVRQIPPLRPAAGVYVRGVLLPPGPLGGTISDVIARMEQIDARLPSGDGVRAFNRMYLLTTRQVQAALAAEQFQDPRFLHRLDVRFADEFFLVFDGAARSPVQSRAWRPLFEARGSSGIIPLQFALAGMNAHINYDLARAVVTTARELGGGLTPARRADYLRINAILARTQDAVRAELLSGALTVADRALGRADDRASLWGIEAAREFAWTTAETLWTLGSGDLADAFTRNLDRMVGLSSKLLLQPI